MIDCKIDRLFPPYRRDVTPYKQYNFDWKVVDFCDQQNQLIEDPMIGSSKCIVVGDASVGKTCLVKRFCENEFSCLHKDTIGVDFEVKTFAILGSVFDLQIWDTAGQEKFCCIVRSYYRGANVAILVFDYSNIASLASAIRWYRQVMDSIGESKPLLFLVGTKKDSVSSATFEFVEREAIKICDKMDAEYWSVSAKTGEGVCELFGRVATLSFQSVILSKIKQLEETREKGDAITKVCALKKSQSTIYLNKKRSINRIKRCCSRSH